MKYPIVILNGLGGVGKDTFAEACAAVVGSEYCSHISTVDYVKDIARDFGWKGTKTFEDRRCLAMLKDILTYWDDIPYFDVFTRALAQVGKWRNEQADFGIIFIDCREPKEIQRLVDGMGAKTVLITRDNMPSHYGNHADDDVFDYQYDYLIDNSGTLDDLHASAQRFIEAIKAEE